MPTYAWATPRKAFEYYLDYAGRTPADLWRAVYDGHIRVQIQAVEFTGDQIRALLELLHSEIPENMREYELPIWMAVNVDDVERSLCRENLPEKRKGRPTRTRTQAQRDYKLAREVSKMLGTDGVKSVTEAARLLIQRGDVEGASEQAKIKKVQRAYLKYFRHD